MPHGRVSHNLDVILSSCRPYRSAIADAPPALDTVPLSWSGEIGVTRPLPNDLDVNKAALAVC